MVSDKEGAIIESVQQRVDTSSSVTSKSLALRMKHS
jgi:hypothetical protein